MQESAGVQRVQVDAVQFGTVWYSPVSRGEDKTVPEVPVDIRELCLVIKRGMTDSEVYIISVCVLFV